MLPAEPMVSRLAAVVVSVPLVSVSVPVTVVAALRAVPPLGLLIVSLAIEAGKPVVT